MGTVETSEPPSAGGHIITALAELPPRTILDTQGLGDILGVGERTVRNWTTDATLPPPFKLGHRSCWFVGRVLDHFERAAEQAQAGEAPLPGIVELNP